MDITRERNEIMKLLQEVSDSSLLAQIKQLITKEKVTIKTVEEPKFMQGMIILCRTLNNHTSLNSLILD